MVQGYTIELTTRQLGDGPADMLITALYSTGCFKVVERIAMEELREELELSGITPKQTLKKAYLLVVGAVTALETKAGGLGGGGIALGKQSAHVGLDMV